MTAPVLAVDGLVHRYPGASADAVAGLSFSVNPGEILGLLGPNGAGKTTTVSILATLRAPTAGAVTLGGVDLLARPRAARRFLGWVPQEVALYPTLTARENLAYFGALQGLGGAELARRGDEALAGVGLAERAGDRVGHYSGGMKRRLNLAAALLHEPRLLILDEPTVGIDAQSRRLILQTIRALAARGTAVLYTTHYMEEAQSLCPEVLIVDGGRAVAAGAPETLISDHPGAESLEGLFLMLTGKGVRD